MDELIKKNNELIELYNKNGDKKNYDIQKGIEKILKINDCFKYMQMDTALNILLNLGYTKEEAKEKYKQLGAF